jgi:hypothetical protein
MEADGSNVFLYHLKPEMLKGKKDTESVPKENRTDKFSVRLSIKGNNWTEELKEVRNQKHLSRLHFIRRSISWRSGASNTEEEIVAAGWIVVKAP